MSCNHPLIAVNFGKGEDGKYLMKILPRRHEINIRDLEDRYGHDNLMLLPCGCCAGCKKSHKKEWSVRCELESQYYLDNCMITLTYRPERAPKKLIKRDLQDFIKNLRNKGLKFRYFACGEYMKNGMPHFHIITFGYFPKDAKPYFKSDKGHWVFGSKFIEDIWKNGFISVVEMSPATAAYVAGYVDKKMEKEEFVLMSKRPGIGERYFREHLFDIYAYDNLVGAFGIAKVPRYCDKIADQMFYDLDDLKAKRKKASNLNLINSMLDHGFVNKEEAIFFEGKIAEDKLKRSTRK